MACQGKLEEAEVLLRKIPEEDIKSGFIKEANLGLIAYRRGLFELGEVHYRNAVNGFKKHHIWITERVARGYFAREAMLAKCVTNTCRGNPSTKRRRDAPF